MDDKQEVINFLKSCYSPIPIDGYPSNAVRNAGSYKRWNFISSILSTNDSKKILDIGCNLGFFSFSSAKLGHDVIGVDTDKECINIAKKIAKIESIDNVKFQHLTTSLLTFLEEIPDDTYDYTFYLSVHHHIYEQDSSDVADKILNEISRISKYMLFDMGQPDEKDNGWLHWIKLMPNFASPKTDIIEHVQDNSGYEYSEIISSTTIHDTERWVYLFCRTLPQHVIEKSVVFKDRHYDIDTFIQRGMGSTSKLKESSSFQPIDSNTETRVRYYKAHSQEGKSYFIKEILYNLDLDITPEQAAKNEFDRGQMLAKDLEIKEHVVSPLAINGNMLLFEYYDWPNLRDGGKVSKQLIDKVINIAEKIYNTIGEFDFNLNNILYYNNQFKFIDFENAVCNFNQRKLAIFPQKEVAVGHKTVCIVGVLDIESSTNVAMAIAFQKLGYNVIPVNYRTILRNNSQRVLHKLLIHVINKYDPELVLFCKCNGVDPNIVKECSELTTTWLWNPDPWQTIKMLPEVIQHAKYATYSSCNFSDIVGYFKTEGVVNCYNIVEGADTDLYAPTDVYDDYKCDVSFIGKSNSIRDKYKKLLEDNGYSVRFYGIGYGKEAFGNEYAKICSNSKFTLSINTYLDSAGGFSDRLVKNLSCGTCTFHLDETDTLSSYFEDGVDLVVFKDENELVQKLNKLTDEDMERIGKAGRAKVIEKYTWEHSITNILDIITTIEERKCPFCGNSSTKRFENTKFFKCSKCGLFINEPMSPSKVKDINKNFLLSACSTPDREAKRLNTAYEQCVAIERWADVGKVYDIGAASGFFMRAANLRGWEAHGNEISTKAIEWAKGRYNIDIDYGFFEDIKIPSNSFDAVVLWNTLEHTHNPKATIDKCHNILKDGGLIYIKVPNNKTAEELNKHYEPVHLFEFTNECLESHLINSGFELIEHNLEDVCPNYGVVAATYLYRKVMKKKRALIKYHHGLGDVIQLMPHLRYLWELGYTTDIMGMAQNSISHLLDNCQYTDKLIDIPNTWKSPLGFQNQLEKDMKLFEKLSKDYEWSGFANHINMGTINKIDYTSKELNLDITDKVVEVFISKEIEDEALNYIKTNFPNGYIFVHTMIEEHTYHNWDATNWITTNLPNLPIVDTGYNGNHFMCHKNINFTFVLAREATHRILSSSVLVHACDAMNINIDVVNYGRPDRKVWLANMDRVLKIRESGKFIK